MLSVFLVFLYRIKVKEVDGLVAYENYPWPIRTLDTALEKFHHECVRVLVMKVEE